MLARDFAELVDDAVQRGAQWSGRCPAHKDARPSLTWRDGDEGLVVRCHRGCNYDVICAALGVPVPSLFRDARNGHGAAVRQIVATYDYTDAHGTLLYQVVRYDPKDFRQRRSDGRGDWIGNLDGVARVLYRLPHLKGHDVVVVVEGEKDADRLAALGYAATTNAQGAGKWKAEYTRQLRDAGVRLVLILPDNDEPGWKHAQTVAAALRAVGIAVAVIELPGLSPRRESHGEDVSDWLDAGHTPDELRDVLAAATAAPAPDVASDYIESVASFLAGADAPTAYVFPELLPCGVILLLHGEPRARKSLVAFELALAAATSTAPFGLARFRPTGGPLRVLYVQEEDPRDLTKTRLRRLIADRCGASPPSTLSVAVRRGLDLDDEACVTRLLADLERLDIKLLVLDAARRLSAKTDEGPSKVRELIAVLRTIVSAGVTVVIVHHDVKPPQNGQDLRRRSQRASGGDWFAGCECPVHVERVDGRESLVFPEDYKFAADPAPFTFIHNIEGGLITRLIGTDTNRDHAAQAGRRARVVEWLRANPYATKTTMQQARLGRWDVLSTDLDALSKSGVVDAAPGRKAGSWRYYVVGTESYTASGKGSSGTAND